MLTVTRLSKTFGSQLAVDDLSFEVHPGTIYGLLGPNGAGKTTTMKMITGMLLPTAGSASIRTRSAPSACSGSCRIPVPSTTR